jgi:Flp pilus assembly protein CpaB
VDTQNSGSSRRRPVRALLLGAVGVCLLAAAATHWTAPAAAPPPAHVDVVVAARPLEAGQILTAADLEAVPVSTSAMDSAVLHDPQQARGRRLLISLPVGAPVVAAALGPPGPPPGQRLIRVAVDLDHLAADVQVGAVVEVLAVADTGSGTQSNPRPRHVVVVGVATVVDVVWSTAGSAGSARASDSAPPSRASPSASTVVVALRCAAAVARDVIAAEIDSRAVRLVARSVDEPAPAPGSAGADPA